MKVDEAVHFLSVDFCFGRSMREEQVNAGVESVAERSQEAHQSKPMQEEAKMLMQARRLMNARRRKKSAEYKAVNECTKQKR